MDTEEFGKGSLPDPVDPRDYKAEEVFGAVQADWSKSTGLTPPGRRNQGTSQSCVGQSTSYLHDIKDPNKDDLFSARDIYAFIHLPGGGAYIRDGVLRLKKVGQARRSEVPEPEPQTENLMTDQTGITPAMESDETVADAYVLPHNDIEYTAWAVQNYGGVVLGVNGTREGWYNKEFPRPPQAGDSAQWGHALCALDIAVIDGKKYIKCASSWSYATQDYHYLGEDYFSTNNVFNPWVIIPRQGKPMYQKVVKQDGKTYGVRIATPNGDQIIYATGEEQWKSWSKPDSYALHTINQDGTADFSGCVVLPW